MGLEGLIDEVLEEMNDAPVEAGVEALVQERAEELEVKRVVRISLDMEIEASAKVRGEVVARRGAVLPLYLLTIMHMPVRDLYLLASRTLWMYWMAKTRIHELPQAPIPEPGAEATDDDVGETVRSIWLATLKSTVQAVGIVGGTVVSMHTWRQFSLDRQRIMACTPWGCLTLTEEESDVRLEACEPCREFLADLLIHAISTGPREQQYYLAVSIPDKAVYMETSQENIEA